MKIRELKYNLYLVDFTDIERNIFDSVKKEFIKFGIVSYEEIPRKDYVKLLQYFTLQCICKVYNGLNNKKNTVFFVNTDSVDQCVVEFTKEIKKHFPIMLYHTTQPLSYDDPAVLQEITLNLKEYRYSLDYSKYSFNKIKKFCKKYDLESLLADLKP